MQPRDIIPEDPLENRLRIGPRPIGLPLTPGSRFPYDPGPMSRIVNRQQEDVFATPPPFYPTVRRDGSGFLVTVAPGAIGYWNYNSEEGQDPLKFETPTLNGQALTSTPPPVLSVAANQWVVLHVITDKKNQITATPTIISSSDIGRHYLPELIGTDTEDEEATAGREGEYFIKLFRIMADGRIDHRMFSDPILHPYLWTAEIKGEGDGKILIKFNPTEGKYEFRSIRRGGGVDVIQEDEIIKVKFDAENIGEGVELYVEASGDDAKTQFRGIKANEAGQLKVELLGSDAAIRGNEKSGRLHFVNCTGGSEGEVTWEDGLITSSDTIEIRVGDCCDSSSPGA